MMKKKTNMQSYLYDDDFKLCLMAQQFGGEEV